MPYSIAEGYIRIKVQTSQLSIMAKKDSDLFSRLTNSKHKSTRPVSNSKIKKPSFKELLLKVEIVAPPDLMKQLLSTNKPLFSFDLAEEIDIFYGEHKPFEDIDTKVLLKNIEHFKNLDLKTVDDDTLIKTIDAIVSGNIVHNVEAKEGLPVYRARNKMFTVDDQRYDFFEQFSEVWYPHPKYLKNYGRLNLPGQPMFYASENALTTIHEIRSKNETQFALMKYQVKAGQTLKLATIGIQSFDELITSTKKTFHFKWTQKGKQNWSIINNFLKDEFTKIIPQGEEHMYRSTNALLRFFDFPDCDGFIYPSIARNGDINLAIKPKAADRAIEFVGLSYWQNTNYDDVKVRPEDFHCLMVWSKSSENGKINYEPVGPCEIDFGKALKVVKDITYRQSPKKGKL